MRRGLDPASLIAGIAVIAMGTLLLLDQSGDVHLSLGLVGALLAGVAGAVLLASGLFEPERPAAAERAADTGAERGPGEADGD